MTQSDIDVTFLKERPQDQRFWVVRASGGQFVTLFREAGLVAIGHLNPLRLPNGALSNPSVAAFEKGLERHATAQERERSRASISAHANQADSFCNSIKENDLVVTLDSGSMMIGRVSGSAYIDHEPIVQHRMSGPDEKLTHQLRRAVAWGPLLSRGSVPVAMQMSLFAHQTVFNIDRYWTTVYHLLYPCFTFKGRLYLSANIKQGNDLDNFSISQLFALLTGVEVMAKLASTDSDEWEGYPNNVGELSKPLDLRLSSKAEFMSPGTVWSSLLTDGSVMAWATVIYTMLFGGDLKFFKADGLIDIHTRQKLWEMVLRLKKTHNLDKIKADLRVDVPRINTTALEPPAVQKAKRVSKARVTVKPADADDI